MYYGVNHGKCRGHSGAESCLMYYVRRVTNIQVLIRD
jgi:hypothetical protein